MADDNFCAGSGPLEPQSAAAFPDARLEGEWCQRCVIGRRRSNRNAEVFGRPVTLLAPVRLADQDDVFRLQLGAGQKLNAIASARHDALRQIARVWSRCLCEDCRAGDRPLYEQRVAPFDERALEDGRQQWHRVTYRSGLEVASRGLTRAGRARQGGG